MATTIVVATRAPKPSPTYLSERLGIDASRVTVEGRGSDEPLTARP